MDSQAALKTANAEPTAKTAGMLVIAAVVGLVLLRKLSVSVSV